MPRRAAAARTKVEQISSSPPSPFKTILPDNNDNRVNINGLGGLAPTKIHNELETTSRYLHKKFKKVATLEQVSPPNGKRLGGAVDNNQQDSLTKVPSSSPVVSVNNQSSILTIPLNGKTEEESPVKRSESPAARYVCPYCKMACPKPSVLQKHIRAHTNERPYPCHPCGFAFKTKSNLYKHCRSRAHTLKMDVTDCCIGPTSSEEDDEKGTSETVKNNAAPKKIYKPKFHTLSEHDDSGESESDSVNKINKVNRENSSDGFPSKLALALMRPDDPPQPLNLSQKRDTTHTIDGSIIKDILLKARSGLNGTIKKKDSPLASPVTEAAKPCDVKKRKLSSPSNDLGSPQKSVRLFGGEVHVLDSGEAKTLRIETEPNPAFSTKSEIVTISRPGLHSVGRTMIAAETPSPTSPFPGKLVVPIVPISVPGMSSLPYPPPLNNITAFNPLTLPPLPGSGGVMTIVHGGKTIPHVPGMPGPNTLLEHSPLTPVLTPVQSPTIKSPISSSKSHSEPLIKKARPPEEPTTLVQKDPPKLLKLDVLDDTRGEKKFVRPTSLPLKMGATYVAKKAAVGPATVALISPETPRPRKSYGQLYLNGHAYTYLGLKCSTRMFFCTLNKPQPIYLPLLPHHAKLSMYSNWKVCSETVLSPEGISASNAMSSYDSRNRSSVYTVASKTTDLMVHSSYTSSIKDQKDTTPPPNLKKDVILQEDSEKKRVKVCDGGYESNEDYIYVRGRGRGRYVCEECGIRCKKPSMLKKHIRTHTDVRPYTCKHCAFSFKTKGNLTKHMKSKSHYKRCVEMDISPVPTTVQECNIDREVLAKQEALRAERGNDVMGSSEESEEDEDTDEDDEDETDEDGHSLEREAAASLLSLSEVAIQSTMQEYSRLGLLSTSARPSTYPYTTTKPERCKESGLNDEIEFQHDDDVSQVSNVGPLELIVDKPQSPSPPPVALLGQTSPDSPYPMDLSNKHNELISCVPVVTSSSLASNMLASIVSTTDRVATAASPVDAVEESLLLNKYLREKAAWQTQIKHQQVADSRICRERNDSESSVDSSHSSVSSAHSVTSVHPAKESALGILAMTTNQVSKSPSLLPPPLPPQAKPKAEFMPPNSANYLNVSEDGKSVCGICQKVFTKPSQLRLHVNIHYFERPYRCEACAVSFRTNGHLQKHQRSLSHLNKVNMNSTFGTATTTNPRPFKCDDCKIAFRIHGHLAKHLRSKMHIMRLECLGKLPFGMYAELERAGLNMNEIDTTDCDNSLESLQMLAQRMHEKDPSKLGQWAPPETSSNSQSMTMVSCGETSSDEDEPRTMAISRLSAESQKNFDSSNPHHAVQQGSSSHVAHLNSQMAQPQTIARVS